MFSEVYRRARLNADAHVQVAIDHGASWPHTLVVSGRIVRVFADRTGGLEVGQRIAFPQPFHSRLSPDAGPTRLAWARAGAAEAYLRGFSGEWSVTHDQFTLLRRATATPINPAAGDQAYLAEEPGLSAPSTSRDHSAWSVVGLLAAMSLAAALGAAPAKASSVYADPARIDDGKAVAVAVSAALPDISAPVLARRVASQRRFVWIIRAASETDVRVLGAKALPGLGVMRDAEASDDRRSPARDHDVEKGDR